MKRFPTGLSLSGTQTADKFVLDSSFIEEISQYFTVEATSPKNEEETLQPMIPETKGGDSDAE